MTDSANHVDTTSRLARWRIDYIGSSHRKSNHFMIGKWNWYLVVEKYKKLGIRLFPLVARDIPLIASFNIRVISNCKTSDHQGKFSTWYLLTISPLVGLGNGVFNVRQAALKAASCKVQKHERACIENQHVFIPFAFDTFGFLAPEAVELLKRVQRVMHSNVMTPRSLEVVFKRIGFVIQKGLAAQLVARLPSSLMYKQLKFSEGFLWITDIPSTTRFIVEVEFLDLKTASPNGSKFLSIWSEGFTNNYPTALSYLRRMLSENIHSDIIICASNGTIGAVLAARSPVFNSMFSHNLKEKEMSTINISDMSIEACQAFLSYIYCNMQNKDFLAHRLDLLRAADKYDISDLKDACEESLIEDIHTKNVLERLQCGSMYRLPKLKACCFQYLVKFGKIFDIGEEFNRFIQSADRDLIGEVVNEILSVWKGF